MGNRMGNSPPSSVLVGSAVSRPVILVMRDVPAWTRGETGKMDEPEFLLVTGPDPTRGLVAERGEVVLREHDGMTDTYLYSGDRNYRWRFDRRWGDGPSLTWVGLNPGTGDRDHGPRPTLQRMVMVSRREGYCALSVVNLFGWRAQDPRALRKVTDPIGYDNDAVLASTASAGMTDRTVVCWGVGGRWRGRGSHVARSLITTPTFCLGMTVDGEPRHPLYVRSDVELVPWPGVSTKG
jgi:hypothetical protein